MAAGGAAPTFNWSPGGSFGAAGPAGQTPREWAHANPQAYYAQYGAAHPWTPPPIPPNLYNPELQVEQSEGKQGVFQAEQLKEQQATQAQNTFGTNLADLQAREGEQGTAHNEAIQKLGETFSNLARSQGDQANAAGVNYGGATLASAMQRARNEGVSRQGIETGYGNQKAADVRERGKLALGLGQQLESLGLGQQQTAEKGQLYQENLEKLMGTEAAKNGYIAPKAPAPPAMKKLVPWRQPNRRLPNVVRT